MVGVKLWLHNLQAWQQQSYPTTIKHFSLERSKQAPLQLNYNFSSAITVWFNDLQA